MTSDITVLIPTSPIPSHPSTAILDETIANIRKYTNAPIIIMADGVHESLSHRTEDYEKYLRNVADNGNDLKYGDCRLWLFEHHTHQAIMTARVLKEVKSDLIFFVEHDTSPIGDIPFGALCEMIRMFGTLNYIRLNIFHTILPEHKHLMLDEIDFGYGQKLTRTIQWSQRPHIANRMWYRDLLYTYMNEKKTMIEDVMHGVVVNKYKELGIDTFGLAIYTPDGNQLRSYHSDGRKDDEKIIEG